MLTYMFRVLAVMVFAYLVWRKMRDDMGETVNSFLWSTLVAFFVGGRMGWSLVNLLDWNSNIWDWLFFWDKPGFNLLAGMICLFAFVFLHNLFERWAFVELAEEILLPAICLGLLWLTSNWFMTNNQINLWVGLALLIVYLFSFWTRKYRSFYWYRSGKKGFLFLSSGLIFCLLMVGISYMIDIWVFYRYLGLIFGLIFMVSLVMLGELVNFDRRKNE